MGFLSKSCSFDGTLAYGWLSFGVDRDRNRFLIQLTTVIIAVRTTRAPGWFVVRAETLVRLGARIPMIIPMVIAPSPPPFLPPPPLLLPPPPPLFASTAIPCKTTPRKPKETRRIVFISSERHGEKQNAGWLRDRHLITLAFKAPPVVGSFGRVSPQPRTPQCQSTSDPIHTSLRPELFELGRESSAPNRNEQRQSHPMQ